MNFEQAVRTVLSRALVFEGRAPRAEYWWWVLAYLLVLLIASGIDGMLFGGAQILSSLASLALLLPTLAVAVRRLHDRGLTGWWVLLGLIPLLGSLILIFIFVQPSEAETNAYGPPPIR